MQITSSYRNPFIHSEPGRASEYKMKCWAVRTTYQTLCWEGPLSPSFRFFANFFSTKCKGKISRDFLGHLQWNYFWFKMIPLPFVCVFVFVVSHNRRDRQTEDRVNSIQSCQNPWKWNDSCCFLAVSIYFLPPSDPQRKIFLLWQILFVGGRQTVAK